MAALTTTVGEILKTYFEGYPEDLVNSGADLLGRLRKDYSATGKEIVTLKRVGGTGSIGYLPEAGNLHEAGAQQYKQSTVTPKELWATLKISQMLLSQAKGGRGSFVEGLASEMENLGKDFRKFIEIRLPRDGSGTIGHCRAESGWAASDVADETENAISINIWEARRFEVGMKIKVWDTNLSGATQKLYAAGGTAAMEIASIQESPNDSDGAWLVLTTSTQILDASHTMAAGDAICEAGARTSTVAYEIEGFGSAVHNQDSPMAGAGGGFQGITSPYDYTGTAQAGSYRWAAPVISNGGVSRPLGEREIMKAFDAVDQVGNGHPDTLIVSFGVKTDFALRLMNVRRRMNSTSLSGAEGAGVTGSVQGDASEGGPSYANHPIIPNRFMDPTVAFVVQLAEFVLKVWARIQFWDMDGNVLRRAPGRTTEFEAEMFTIHQFCVGARNASARITDISNREVYVL